MKFYERAIDGTNSYTEVEKDKASFFQNANGDIKPIGELLANKDNNIHLDVNGNEIITNVPANDSNLPEPLLMPSMNFDKKEKKNEDVVQTNEAEGLPLPIMKF